MPTTDVLNGTLLGLYINGNLVAHSTDCSMTMSESHRDAASKDTDGWPKKLEGERDWSVSGSYLVALDGAYTIDDLADLYINRTQVTMRFSTNVSGDKYLTGSCRLSSLDTSSPKGDNVTGSYSLEGSSAVTNPSLT